MRYHAAVVMFPDGLWPGVREPRFDQEAFECSSSKGGAMFGREEPRYGDRGRGEGVAHHFFLLKSDCREENERVLGDRHGNKSREVLCVRSCLFRGSVNCMEHNDYAVPGESTPRKGVGLGNLKVRLPL